MEAEALQRLWSMNELGARWTLPQADLALLTDLPDTSKLGFAAQVGVRADALDGYDWAGRTGHRLWIGATS